MPVAATIGDVKLTVKGTEVEVDDLRAQTPLLWILLRREGTTILLTTQYLEEADQLADEIAVIDHGRVIAEGTGNELKDRVGGQILEAEVTDVRQRDEAEAALVRVGCGPPEKDERPNRLTLPAPRESLVLVEEAAEFVQAVHATGGRKLIICALWTEICMAFTALDALREGNEIYPVVDAIGGTSPEAHRAGLDRVIQAGGQPISWVSLAVELQRDWARQDTVQAIIEIVLTDRLLKEQ